MENRYKITYDIKQRNVTSIRFKQGDVDSSVLEVNLVDNSLPINITGEIIEFRFLKPDKTVVYQDSSSGVNVLDATKGKVECVLSSNTLGHAGEAKCEIHRTIDGKELTTPQFTFTVEGSIGEDGLFSTNYISIIENIKNEYNEAIRSDTNLEVVAARKGEETLPDKIDLIDSQLAEKAKQTDLVNGLTLKRDKSVKLGQLDMSEEFLQQMAGTTPINAIPADGSIGAAKLTNDFCLRGTGGADLNTLFNEGTYYTNGYALNQPVPYAILGAMVVKKTGVNTIVQTFYKEGKLDEVYSRSFDITVTPVPSFQRVQIFPPTNLERSSLSANFSMGRELISSDDLNLIIEEGVYFCARDAINAPAEFASTLGQLFLEVKRYSNAGTNRYYVIQTLHFHQYGLAEDSTKIYWRFMDTQNLSWAIWLPLIPRHPRYGKTLLTTGDSITASVTNYPTFVAKILNLILTNAGYSGATMAWRNNASYDPHSFVGATSGSATTGYDIITVGYGTNDYAANIPLGTIDSVNSNEFYGAMNNGITNIYAVNPSVRIAFILPTFRHSEDTPNSLGLTLQDYRVAITNICNKYNIFLIDPKSKLGINELNYTTILQDGLHPSTTTAEKIYAPFIAGQLSTII